MIRGVADVHASRGKVLADQLFRYGDDFVWITESWVVRGSLVPR